MSSSPVLSRWLPWVLVLAGFALYLNTLGNEFVFDDEPHIVLSERIGDLPGELAQFGRDRRWTVRVSLALNYAIEGLEPRGYHLFNLLVHIAAALALFGVVHRTLLLPRWEGRYETSAVWWALAVALLWIAHPLNTQAVTYTIQRAESMLGMFFLLSLYAYIRQWQAAGSAGRVGWSALCLASAGLALMTKEVAIALPLVMLAYDRVFLRGVTFGAWIRRRAAIGVGLLAGCVWLVAASTDTMRADDASAGFGMPVFSPLGYLITQPKAIAIYLARAFWPHPLVLDYHELPAVPPDTPPDMVARLVLTRVLPYAVPVLLLLGAGVSGFIRRRWWGFCLLAFFLILAPTSSVLPIADAVVEHRMYLPLTCLVAIVVFGAGELLRRFDPQSVTRVGVPLLIAVALALGARTVARNDDYRSKVAIWDTVVVSQPTNPRGWHNLGSALSEAGRHDEAMYCFEMVLRIVPHYAAAHAGMGDIYLDRHQPGEAIAHYRQAVAVRPDEAAYHYDLGRALLMVGQWDEARAALGRAIELQPRYPKAYNNLGLVHIQQARYDEAVAALRRSIEQDADQFEPYINLALAYERMGRFDDAIAAVRQAIAVAQRVGAPPQQLDGFTRRLRALELKAGSAPASP